MSKPHTPNTLYHSSSASFVILINLHASGQTDVQILDLIRWLARDEQSSVPRSVKIGVHTQTVATQTHTLCRQQSNCPTPNSLTTTPLLFCRRHESKNKSEGHSQEKYLAQHCQVAHQALLAVPLHHPKLSIVRHFGQSSCQWSD